MPSAETFAREIAILDQVDATDVHKEQADAVISPEQQQAAKRLHDLRARYSSSLHVPDLARFRDAVLQAPQDVKDAYHTLYPEELQLP